MLNSHKQDHLPSLKVSPTCSR